MEKEIRTCFGLYLNYIKQHIKNLREYDIDAMSISDMDAQLDVIHMQYILTSSYSLSKTSPGLIAYNHLKTVIRNSRYNMEPKMMYNLDNNLELDPSKKGWFF